ncbi:MAG TPA: cobalamin-binding protein, partial [Firmicutes bacterium]|nr:cobalamin-binding protein [Bacillota bacterium]
MTDILTRIASAVLEGNREETLKQVEAGLASGYDPLEMINGGLSPGLEAVGDKFECGEYFLPDMMLAAGAMSAALGLLEPHLQKKDKDKQDKPARVVIGTVKGDLHSIGKDIVIMMMRAAGMEVFDLGVDVPAGSFVKALQ